LKTEQVILSHLLLDETYTRRVLPYLKEEYFRDQADQLVFKLVADHVGTYNLIPTSRELLVGLDGISGVPEGIHKDAVACLGALDTSKSDNEKWLLDVTEQFCQERAITLALSQAIEINDDKSGKYNKGSIPQILSEALSVSFDPDIGHDYFEDADTRWEFYHLVEKKIPFHLDYLNRITRGGIVPKTLTVIIAGTGVGKSLAMCDFAAAHLQAGYNVLYLTMEMAEEKIAERIDANLCNVELDKLADLSKPEFIRKIDNLKSKTAGKLLIKEYPNGSVSAQHFRALLNELKLKKTFKPDIIYVDYLNICSSSRLRMDKVNSYAYIKSIAEELRSLAQEFDIPVFSATQTNRGGFGSTDVDVTDTSESFGLPMTVDLMFALMQPEEFAEKQQFLIKQLKNRYTDPDRLRRFVVGVDKAKMRLYDVEDSAQENILGGPAMPTKPPFGESKKSFEDWQ
jgi:archaellum biogenesis ATPase FlaH